MLRPPIPPDDAERVAALRALALLDTPAEERFDRITRTLARLLDVPIALLNLVDDRRQWAKSAVGLPHGHEAERSISFCAHVVGDDAVLSVPDTAADERFHDNPMVLSEDPVACYYGVPIHGPAGHVIGSFCIAGHEPRELTPDEMQILRDLVQWVEAELDRDVLAALSLREADLRRQLEVVTEGVGDAVLVFDGRGIVRQANAAFERLWGAPREEVLGRHVSVLVPSDTGAGARLARLLEDAPLRSAIGYDVELTRADGRTVPVELTVSSPEVGDAFIVVARDGSERRLRARLLDQLRRRYETLLDTAGDAIVGITADGSVDYANPAAETLFEVGPGELLGRHLHAGFHHRRRDGSTYPWEECPTARTLRDGSNVEVIDEVYFTATGRPIDVAYSSTALETDGRVSGAVLVIRDVAAQRALERLKSEFVSTVSHELRTPLTAIKGALGLAAGGLLGALPDEANQVLAVAERSTDNLIRLVNDLLTLDRLDARREQLVRSPHRLTSVVGDAVAQVAPVAHERAVELRVDVVDLMVDLDQHRIVQALTNLLANAVRFSDAGGTVEVTGARDGDGVHLQVRDEGRGVPTEARERIFERFGQADASDARERAGSGLGLPIARAMVELHGGRLWLGDEAPGACFHLWLPRCAPDPVAAADPETPR